jgi:hypothetical protein
MSQPEKFPTPQGRQVARGSSQLGADGLDPEGEGRREGERTRAVPAAAGSVDLVANP